MARHEFKSKHGNVDYGFTRLPGNCGVVVVSGVVFFQTPNMNRNKQYEVFNKHILSYKGEYDLARAKVIMSDKVGGEIYEFCTYNGWLEGTRIHNPKSGNEIIVFEQDRDPKSVRI